MYDTSSGWFIVNCDCCHLSCCHRLRCGWWLLASSGASPPRWSSLRPGLHLTHTTMTGIGWGDLLSVGIAGKEERHLVADECLLPDACPGWWRWRADDWSCEAHGVCCRSGGPEMQPVLRRDVLDRKRGEAVNWQAGLGACNHSSIFSPCIYILNLLPN